MRIASLVPSATEMLFALGLGGSVVAVTHECDYPPEARSCVRLTRSVIPDGLGAAEIDAAVRELTGAGKAIYELDEEALSALEVDLIVTQALCAVCAVSYDDVRAVAERLPSRPRVMSLDPETLGEVLDDLVRLGEVVDGVDGLSVKGGPVKGLGNEMAVRVRALGLRAALERRLEAVREAVAGAERPRVLALEWLDPPFVGGHWVPEMIEVAGGRDVAGRPGLKSHTSGWEELAAARPDVVIAMPCGWLVEEARREVLGHWEQVEGLGATRVFAVDAASSFSRPGPRLVDGTELLAHLLHPDRVEAPAGIDFADVGSPVRAG